MTDHFDVARPPESRPGAQLPSGLSRRAFLMGTACCAGGLLLSRTPARADILDALKKFLYLDPIVLNYAHEMEELEKDFFERALRSSAFNELEGRERSVFSFIAQQDKAHFEALSMERERRGEKGATHFETRNASSSRPPRLFRYPRGVFDDRQALLHEAVSLKENVVFAYHGAVDLVRDAKLLGPAAAIAGVEGRHLVVLRELAGLDPIPTSFEGQVSPQTVGDRLAKRYGFQGGAKREGALR